MNNVDEFKKGYFHHKNLRRKVFRGTRHFSSAINLAFEFRGEHYSDIHGIFPSRISATTRQRKNATTFRKNNYNNIQDLGLVNHTEYGEGVPIAERVQNPSFGR